ncbi:MAG: hypothetical protein ACUVXA_18455 [Candidatus Jordarchaeum sp.]|uniref:hypothetical protein n=1 Tax=Candidatus Jordarchaeum sp. TaxID=2823881 RepID=UPI00404B5538
MMSEERRKAVAKLMFGKNADIVVNIFPMLLGMWGVPPPAPPPPPEPQKGESKDERKE